MASFLKVFYTETKEPDCERKVFYVNLRELKISRENYRSTAWVATGLYDVREAVTVMKDFPAAKITVHLHLKGTYLHELIYPDFIQMQLLSKISSRLHANDHKNVYTGWRFFDTDFKQRVQKSAIQNVLTGQPGKFQDDEDYFIDLDD